ncbi:hypothetical protein TrLO_g9177 [Triparma laevis f. longispina]|uniref:Uncharacterized protein n=1 Tax=Triparma laevis f. longispina TaxID=1714387 RepID=A0A9W7FJD4_9STRA|nr:hypothetical protein TrLO_g9177 [Triparma laevis f. longispina]
MQDKNTTKQKFASVISELTEANRERDVLRSKLGAEKEAATRPLDPEATPLFKGTILLQPLPLGQTSFTFSAQVKAKEEIARHRLIDHEAPVDDNDGDILGIARPLFLDDILE